MRQPPEHVETVVVGAGHAGLALSRYLTDAGREHVLLERGRVAERWRSERWDSFTLLSPNWHSRLPGFSTPGDPDGFMDARQVIAFLTDYAASFDAPVRTGVNVRAVRLAGAHPFAVLDDQGKEIRARNVVVATGPFQRPALPPSGERLPDGVFQIHSSGYRNPGALPPGAILVVGAGASGQQIVDELYRAGRTVYFSAGEHVKRLRRYRGHDTIWWMDQMGWFDRTVDSLTSPDEAKRRPSAALTGVDGGRDLDLHRFAEGGVVLLGRLRSCEGNRLYFDSDLGTHLTAAESEFRDFQRRVDEHILRSGLSAPEEAPRLQPYDLALHPFPCMLDVSDSRISAVVWATGFRTDFGWIELPIFSRGREPIHTRGVTAQPGLFFLGLRWLYKRKSHFIAGANEDAAYVAAKIKERACR